MKLIDEETADALGARIGVAMGSWLAIAVLGGLIGWGVSSLIRNVALYVTQGG